VPLTPSQPRLSGQPRIEARTSALAKASDLRARRLGGQIGTPLDWQSKVIRFDRDGPGILGYYLDTVALLASLCPLVPAVRGGDGKWQRSDDPVLNVLAAGYRSPLFEQHELVSLHVRHREAVGEAWVIWSHDIGWSVITVPNITASTSDGSVRWTDPYGIQRTTPGDRTYKSWVQDPYEPWLPSAPTRRALPNLKRMHASVRSQIRAADSRLITNGLMAFDPGDGPDARPLRTTPADPGETRDGADKIIDDFIEFATLAFQDDDSVAAHVPFPYLGAPAQHVDVGRGIDQYAMAMEEKAIEAFSRDVNFPAQLLTSGPGAANHWNEWILQEVQQKMGLAPKLNPVCADITSIYFRPAVRAMRNRVGSWDMDPARVRLEPDYTFLTSKPDKAAKAIEAYRSGAIGREEMVDELGFSQLMELPDGLSEYEHWQIVTGRPGAPYIEVDAQNRVIVAPEDPGGGGFEGLADLPLADDEGAEDAELVDAPAELPAGDDPGAVEEAMPEEPVVAAVAALSGEDEDLETLIERLIAVDVALAAALTGMASMAATAAMVEVAKAVIRAYPPRHEDRARLRELPPEEVWAAADSSVRASVDVEAVAAEALAPYREQIEEQFAEAAAAIAQLHSDSESSSAIPEILVAAATLALLAAITRSVYRWATAGPAGFTPDGDEKPSRKRKLHVPTADIVAAMLVAGGALVAADGSVVRDPSGNPQAGDGGRWQGGTGTATGNNSVTALKPRPGVEVKIRWIHGLWRTPVEPFLPHVALDRQEFDSLADVPGGYHPQDHRYCTCGIVPVIKVRVPAPDTMEAQ